MIRHRTPLRYPGGKQRLAPFVEEILDANGLADCHYAEPYAGGAGVAMELLLSRKVSKVHLNDSCRGIYGFWRSILDHPEALCRRISSACLSVEEWRRQKEIFSRLDEFDLLDAGFSLFYLNRCYRSGIPSGGLIGGIKQEGTWRMDARFNRLELIQRIELISDFRKKIKVSNLDAERFLLERIPSLPLETLVYCDPPYFKKADRLYPNYYLPNDHERIAQVIQRELTRPWVVSYDNAPEIQSCYSARRAFSYQLQYNAGEVRKGTELFIFSDSLKLPKNSVIPSIDTALSAL